MAKPVALITGGARGIGRAIARHLLGSGWQAGLIDLPDSGLRRVFSRERGDGDVRDEETASDAVEALVHRFSRLDAEYPMPESLVFLPVCGVYVAPGSQNLRRRSVSNDDRKGSSWAAGFVLAVFPWLLKVVLVANRMWRGGLRRILPSTSRLY